jgi:hypothetical protein
LLLVSMRLVFVVVDVEAEAEEEEESTAFGCRGWWFMGSARSLLPLPPRPAAAEVAVEEETDNLPALVDTKSRLRSIN